MVWQTDRIYISELSFEEALSTDGLHRAVTSKNKYLVSKLNLLLMI